jgi:hypothetical protein
MKPLRVMHGMVIGSKHIYKYGKKCIYTGTFQKYVTVLIAQSVPNYTANITVFSVSEFIRLGKMFCLCGSVMKQQQRSRWRP